MHLIQGRGGNMKSRNFKQAVIDLYNWFSGNIIFFVCFFLLADIIIVFTKQKNVLMGILNIIILVVLVHRLYNDYKSQDEE
jgi:type II secretory pathway component PulF